MTKRKEHEDWVRRRRLYWIQRCLAQPPAYREMWRDLMIKEYPQEKQIIISAYEVTR